MIHNTHRRRPGAGDSSCQAVEAFYNQRRGHSTRGQISLAEEDGAATARAGSCRLYLERRAKSRLCLLNSTAMILVATLAGLF